MSAPNVSINILRKINAEEVFVRKMVSEKYPRTNGSRQDKNLLAELVK